MSRTDDFFTAVNDAATGTSLVVTRTETGFDVTTNIVDATWIAVLYKQGLRKVFTHHVKVDDDEGTYSITDDEYDVRWSAGVKIDGGVPTAVLSKSVQRTSGTVKKFETRTTFAFDDDGEFAKVVDYTHSSEDNRKIIRQQADRLGLEQKMGTITRIGLAFAAAGIVVALVSLVLIVVALS